MSEVTEMDDYDNYDGDDEDEEFDCGMDRHGNCGYAVKLAHCFWSRMV